MSKWITNLRHQLSHRRVTILHGNVRDIYVDDGNRVYDNLTALLKSIATELPIEMRQLMVYDAASGLRRENLRSEEHTRKNGDANMASEIVTDDLADTAPDARTASAEAGPERTLANWNKSLRGEDGQFVILHYLDKLVAYKKTYTEEEQRLLLWLEKTIENIGEGNRLVLVALRDSMVPIELYTNSPTTRLLDIPCPGVAERTTYLEHRLAPSVADSQTVEYLAGVTDGLLLRELQPIARAVAEQDGPLSQRELHRLVNKYRVGEQEDHWGQLSIERIRHAYDFFVEEEGVKGQDDAIGKVIDTLCLARAGLSGVSSGTPTKPRGVLFFAGPTGVGKTLLAKKLAKFLFTTEDAFLRFDMSEFKEDHTVSKLIGSPPGYVGFEEGGALTNGVREKPFSVVLFDEIEKAHPKILDIYLQLLDDGRLTDSRGQTVYFTETIIIFTSNIGTRSSDSSGRPIDERGELQSLMQNEQLAPRDRQLQIQKHFASAVERFFAVELSRPELLNRIGNRIVPFNPIDATDVQRAIVSSHLMRIQEEIADPYRRQRVTVDFQESVMEWLVQTQGPRIAQFGGRGIANAVEDEILTPLARKLLQTEEAGEIGVKLSCSFCAKNQRMVVSTGVLK